LIESVRGEESSRSNEVNSTQAVEFCRELLALLLVKSFSVTIESRS
jgi:hypothetical protein